MNDDTQKALVEVLVEMKRKHPEWRMGQVVANLSDWADRNIWDVEDEELLVAARRHLENYEQPSRAAV